MSIKSLKHALELLGFKDKHSLLLSRYLIEARASPKLAFSDDQTSSQANILQRLSSLLGPYQLFD